MGNSNLLFESLFKRKFSAVDTREYLTKIAGEHPYFSPAQFFLLLLAEKGTKEYEQQVAKTAVLFNNPYWLQFQLQENEQPDEISNRDDTVNNKLPLPENPVSFIPGNTAPVEAIDIAEEINASHLETDELNGEGDISPIREEALFSPAPELSTDIDNNVPGTTEVEDEIVAPLQSGHFNNEGSPLINETEREDNAFSEPEIEPLNFKLNIDTANATEDSIVFEPLHTSDYFASLGIKLSGDIKPSDKLGKQLKSFTEWLKTMKKIHPDQIPSHSGEANISIQKLAEQSNKEAAVFTEAMADILLQQGKANKALEVYKKLSLLNPSKSAYFAAKIDQLKEH